MVKLAEMKGEERKSASPLEMVQSGHVEFSVPDLGKAQAVLNAFMPEEEARVGAGGDRPAEMRAMARGREVFFAAAPKDGARGDEPIGRRAPAQRRPKPAEDKPKPEKPVEPSEGPEEEAEPLLPIVLGPGSVKGAVDIRRDAEGIHFDVKDVAGKAISFKRGAGSLEPMDIGLNLAAVVNQDAGGVLRASVSQLAGNLGIAKVNLAEPLKITHNGSAFDANGAVKVEGALRPLMQLLAALDAQPKEKAAKYEGKYVATQKLETREQALALTGELDLNDFMAGEGAQRVAEKHVRVENRLVLNQAAKALDIEKLTVAMTDSRALELGVSGKVSEFETNRKLEKVELKLARYDTAKLLDMIRPMLSEEGREQLKGLKVSGVVENRVIHLGGSYPQAPKANRIGRVRPSIYYLKGDGSLLFPEVSYHGMPAKDLVVPFVLDKGVLKTVGVDGKRPEAVAFSGGTMDIGGFEINLASDTPRISHPDRDHKLLEKVSVPSEFVDQIGGKVSPLFANADKSKGMLSVTVTDLKDLPLGEALMSPKKKQGGKGAVTFTLDQFAMRAPFVGDLVKQLGVKTNEDGSMPMSIKDAKVSLADGQVTGDFDVGMLGQMIGNKGTIRLKDNSIVNMHLRVPKALIPLKDVQQFKLLKDQIEVPVIGTTKEWHMDIAKAAVNSIDPSRIIDTIPGLLGGEKEKPEGGKKKP
jgi:hypothetical protein